MAQERGVGGNSLDGLETDMRMLQRYILGELLRVFAFVLSVLTVLLVFVGAFQQARDSGLGPLQILEILPFVVPSLLPFTIPATLLLTVSVVYGRIAGDQEITAAMAAGMLTNVAVRPPSRVRPRSAAQGRN